MNRLALLIVSLAIPAAAQRATNPKLAELDAIFAKHVAATKLPGLSVGVVLDGRLVLAKGYGKRSLEDDLPVQTDTRFAIGSVTKQFTSACVLLLQEAGKLSVHDAVAKYYPNLARAEDITLLDLMNHVSGYPDYYPLDFVDRRMSQPIPADALLEKYAGKGVNLDFEPGTRYSYSNTGYILLGRIVEKVSGESFSSFLRKRILRPLGMTETFYEPDPDRPEIARGYTTFALGPSEPNQPEAQGWVSSAGGIYTTPRDLAKWDIALLERKVVNRESWALMTRSRRLKNGSLTGYGCGLAIGTRNRREVLGHNGAVNGFAASNTIIPSMHAAVILFCNQDGGLGSLANQAVAVLLRDPPKAAPTRVPAIDGPKAEDVVRSVFAMLQTGKVDRQLFTGDFNDYLTDARIAGAKTRLAAFGKPERLTVLVRRERGGMEVTVTRLSFDKAHLRVLMYRHPDGAIAQFFVGR